MMTTTKRQPLFPDAPLREVVYIFEREGDRGSPLWLLVLSCGHSITRRRYHPKNLVNDMVRPIEEKLAPKRTHCMMCSMGVKHADPAVLIAAFGGPTL